MQENSCCESTRVPVVERMNSGQLPDAAWCSTVGGDGVVDQGGGIVVYLDPENIHL